MMKMKLYVLANGRCLLTVPDGTLPPHARQAMLDAWNKWLEEPKPISLLDLGSQVEVEVHFDREAGTLEVVDAPRHD